MKQETSLRLAGVDNNELARQCLRLISEIASRGARSQDPGQIGYALQELTQVLLERTGQADRLFEPVPADQIGGLSKLYEELDFVNGCSQDLMASALSRPNRVNQGTGGGCCVNGTLSSRDRCHRGGNFSGQSRSARPVPGAGGLIEGTADTPKRRTPG